MSRLIAFITLLPLLLTARPGQAQNRFFLLEDPAQAFSPTQALQGLNSQRPATGQQRNFGFTRSVFWLRLDYRQPLADSTLLHIGDAHINRIRLYRVQNGQVSLLSAAGDYFPFSQRPVPARGFYFPLPDTGQYLLRIDKSYESFQLSFDLESYWTVIRTEADETGAMALFSGMVLVLAIFGLFLFALARDPVYGLYVLYLSSGWLWVLAQGGFGFQYLWPDAVWFASKARPVFALTTVALSVLFMLHYVGSRVPKLVRVSTYVFCIALGVCVAIALLLNDTGYRTEWWINLQKTVPVIVGIYMLLSIGFLVRQAFRGDRLALFYLVAIGSLVFFMTLQILFYTGRLQASPVIRYGVPIGYIVEAIVLTAGLAYRFHQYRRDRERMTLEMQQRQQENVRMLMQVQQSERSAIANQLHDVAGSLLSAARLNLSSVLERDPLQPAARQKLEKTEEAVDLVSETVRNLSHALSPVMLHKVGLRKALEKVVSLFNAAGKIRISLVVLGFEAYTAERESYYTALYGMVYELLNNTVKHAGATQALVQVIEHEDGVSLVVEDDGRGMKSSIHSESQGLDGLSSKVAYYKGQMLVEDNRPSGSIITIEVPYPSYAV